METYRWDTLPAEQLADNMVGRMIVGVKEMLVHWEIKKGTLKNRGEEIVKEPIDAGLLREDRKYIYPIREDIPIMLIDEAIPFEQFDKK